ncbi:MULTISPECIES: EF-hand domain-containing protein [unclassified Streptomyces]|uniref:EF-hand domain-containing protein n=1 Tax=unclassified Streptomyces TaxID=2593676 RepID=UPI0004C446BF
MTTVAHDLAATKYGRVFDLLDADGSGYLEWPDFQALADRHLTAYGIDRNDRRARVLLAHYQMLWLELLRHSDVQGDRLNREEYVLALRLLLVDTSRVNVVEGGGHAMFDLIDTDGDNEIGKDEFLTFLRNVWQVTDPAALDTFDAIDADGDGLISRPEFLRTLREYYYSANPEAPGSALFGVL